MWWVRSSLGRSDEFRPSVGAYCAHQATVPVASIPHDVPKMHDHRRRCVDVEAYSAAMDDATQVVRLFGVYDADHTIRGEVSYWVGARLGRAHCSLCDITHGLLRRRSEWNAYVAGLDVRFETFHRDDQPDAVRVASGDRVPVVAAELATGATVLLVDPEALDACGGSVERLGVAIDAALTRQGLRLRPSRRASS